MEVLPWRSHSSFPKTMKMWAMIFLALKENHWLPGFAQFFVQNPRRFLFEIKIVFSRNRRGECRNPQECEARTPLAAFSIFLCSAEFFLQSFFDNRGDHFSNVSSITRQFLYRARSDCKIFLFGGNEKRFHFVRKRTVQQSEVEFVGKIVGVPNSAQQHFRADFSRIFYDERVRRMDGDIFEILGHLLEHHHAFLGGKKRGLVGIHRNEHVDRIKKASRARDYVQVPVSGRVETSGKNCDFHKINYNPFD